MRSGGSDFDDVGLFHSKFGLPFVDTPQNIAGPREVDEELMRFRIKFMREELQEFEDAYATGDEAGMFDALLDLVYVAMGTAHLRGYPWKSGWDEVQRANMTKERAAPDGSNSKRGSSWDVVKPDGWTPPRIDEVLAMFGFRPSDSTPEPPRRCRQCQRDLSQVTLKEVVAQSAPRVDIHCPCGAYIGSRPV